MVTNNIMNVCPKCSDINHYIITKMELVDTDLHVSYLCENCGAEYTDVYALVYLGGHMLAVSYDRDNVITANATV